MGLLWGVFLIREITSSHLQVLIIIYSYREYINCIPLYQKFYKILSSSLKICEFISQLYLLCRTCVFNVCNGCSHRDSGMKGLFIDDRIVIILEMIQIPLSRCLEGVASFFHLDCRGKKI